jgi:hypothetical protein
LGFFAVCYGWIWWLGMKSIKLVETHYLEVERQFDQGVATIDAVDAASLELVRVKGQMVWPFCNRRQALLDHVHRLQTIEDELTANDSLSFKSESQSGTLGRAIDFRKKAERMVILSER